MRSQQQHLILMLTIFIPGAPAPSPPPPSPPPSPPPTSVWRFSEIAASCDTACALSGLACNEAALGTVTSVEVYQHVAANALNQPTNAGWNTPINLWHKPGGHNLATLSPFVQTGAFPGFIFLPAVQTGTPPTCDAAARVRNRLCSCGVMSPPPPTPPPTPPPPSPPPSPPPPSPPPSPPPPPSEYTCTNDKFCWDRVDTFKSESILISECDADPMCAGQHYCTSRCLLLSLALVTSRVAWILSSFSYPPPSRILFDPPTLLPRSLPSPPPSSPLPSPPPPSSATSSPTHARSVAGSSPYQGTTCAFAARL